MASHVFEHLSHDESLALLNKMIGVLKETMPELKKIISGSDEQRTNKINELLISIAEEYDLTADVVVPGEAFRRAQKRQRNDAELDDVQSGSQQPQGMGPSTQRSARRPRLMSPGTEDTAEHQQFDSSTDDSVSDEVDSPELKGHPKDPCLWEHHFYRYSVLYGSNSKHFVSEANNKEPRFKTAMIVARQGRIVTKRCDHCVNRGTFCVVKDGYNGCSQCLFRQHGSRCTLFNKK